MFGVWTVDGTKREVQRCSEKSDAACSGGQTCSVCAVIVELRWKLLTLRSCIGGLYLHPRGASVSFCAVIQNMMRPHMDVQQKLAKHLTCYLTLSVHRGNKTSSIND